MHERHLGDIKPDTPPFHRIFESYISCNQTDKITSNVYMSDADDPSYSGLCLIKLFQCAKKIVFVSFYSFLPTSSSVIASFFFTFVCFVIF